VYAADLSGTSAAIARDGVYAANLTGAGAASGLRSNESSLKSAMSCRSGQLININADLVGGRAPAQVDRRIKQNLLAGRRVKP